MTWVICILVWYSQPAINFYVWFGIFISHEYQFQSISPYFILLSLLGTRRMFSSSFSLKHSCLALQFLKFFNFLKLLFQFESTVKCSDEDNGRMDYKLILFWNIFYSLMIVTAVLGNCAVLWIVIRKKTLQS